MLEFFSCNKGSDANIAIIAIFSYFVKTSNGVSTYSSLRFFYSSLHSSSAFSSKSLISKGSASDMDSRCLTLNMCVKKYLSNLDGGGTNDDNDDDIFNNIQLVFQAFLLYR